MRTQGDTRRRKEEWREENKGRKDKKYREREGENGTYMCGILRNSAQVQIPEPNVYKRMSHGQRNILILLS